MLASEKVGMMDGKQRWTIEPNVKVEKVAFTRFSNAKTREKGVLTADFTKNCDCKNGALTRGLGYAFLLNGSGAKMRKDGGGTFVAMAYSYVKAANGYDKHMMALDDAGALRMYSQAKNGFENAESFGAGRKMLSLVDENKQFQYVVYGKTGVSLFNEETGRRDLGFGATAACVYNDRLFLAVTPFRILYSQPGNPTEFEEVLDESGEIFHFAGTGDEVVAMQALENCIYLFTAHGITRLRVKGAAREFTIESVPYVGGEIFGDSVGVFGDRICFLASDGVYLFDGNRAKKAYEKLPIFPKRVGQVCNYGVFEGEYLIGYVDREGESKTLVLDVDGENGYFAFAPNGLCSLEGEMIFHNQNYLLRLDHKGDLPTGENAIFTSEILDFGKKAAVKEVRLIGEGDVVITVSADEVDESVALTCTGGMAKAKLHGYGESFVIALQLNGAEAKVYALELTVEKLRG